MNWNRLAAYTGINKEPIHEIPKRKRRWVNHDPDPSKKFAASISALYTRPICQVCGDEKTFEVAAFDFICNGRKHVTVTPPKPRFDLDAWLAEFWK